MSVIFVIVLAFAGLAVNWLKPRKAVSSAVLVLSALSIYWLQPLTPIRNLDYWLPTLSIGLTILVWAITYPGERSFLHPAFPGLAVLILVVIGVALTRYWGIAIYITPARPPQLLSALLVSGLILILFFLSFSWLPNKPVMGWIALFTLIALFIILKSEPLSQLVSSWLRRMTGQSPGLAAPGNLAWLGFSFLAFRLLHAIRDRQANRLPAYTLGEFASYALFFPAVISGPIDRSQHFIRELQKLQAGQTEHERRDQTLENVVSGFPRILMGAFKKFVLADSLALLALNAQNAAQTTSTGWTWVLLLAYSLRIYLDFSGYTDIALGVARLMGISLPENFDRPYTRLNLTAFWNSWHITLAQWFRGYIFNPFTRAMRTQKRPVPTWAIIFAGQLLTMSLIGLWHGLSWSFFIWGAWHGVGLFVQNRWTSWIGPRLDIDSLHPGLRLAFRGSSWLATFAFVSLGWVWFALPTPQLALPVFARLAGVAP